MPYLYLFWQIEQNWLLKQSQKNEVIFFLKTNKDTKFKQLIEITAIDFPQNEKRFKLVYLLLSHDNNKRLIVDFYIKENDIMDQEVEIINTETRKEKIKNFIINKRNTIISILVFFVLILFGYFIYQEYLERNRVKLANKYNSLIIEYENGNESNILNSMKEIIKDKDRTYSPLAFYYLLDNNLITSQEEINTYFDIIINEIGLDKENKNLTIFKKGLFNSEFANENELLNILNPVIKSDSIWKPHALYLMAEYYFSKNEKQKSKEFLEKLISLENINDKIKLEAQKRLRSDLSE